MTCVSPKDTLSELQATEEAIADANTKLAKLEYYQALKMMEL